MADDGAGPVAVKSPRRSLTNELNDAGAAAPLDSDFAGPLGMPTQGACFQHLVSLTHCLAGEDDAKYAWEDTERLGPTGDVVKGTLLATSEAVIRKRTQFLNSGQGVPYHVVREVSILKGINHPHIVRLLDVVHEFDSVSLIYECLPRDLRSILDEKMPEYEPGPAIDPLQIKDYYRWAALPYDGVTGVLARSPPSRVLCIHAATCAGKCSLVLCFYILSVFSTET